MKLATEIRRYEYRKNYFNNLLVDSTSRSSRVVVVVVPSVAKQKALAALPHAVSSVATVRLT